MCEKPMPEARLPTPEAQERLLEPRGAPASLPDVLVTGQLTHEPLRQALLVFGQVWLLATRLHVAALLTQEMAKAVEGKEALFCPGGAHLLGLDVVGSSLGIRPEVDFPVGLVIQSQDMAGHGDIEVEDTVSSGAATVQPDPVALQKSHVFRRPGTGWLRAWEVRGERGATGETQSSVVAVGGSRGEAAHCQSSSSAAAA